MKQLVFRGSYRCLPRRAQRGAALVIAAAVITTILAFAALVAGRATRMELRGTYQTSDALQALLAAETGVQRAATRIRLGSACGAAAINETITYPAGVSVVIASKITDFDGATALTSTQCRLEATATVTASNVTRKFSQIIDTSLFDNAAENLAFDSGAPPTGWTFSGTSVGGQYYRTQGGSEAALPPCTTSAYTLKTGAGARNTLGNTLVYFNAYQAAATTFTITFDRRYLIVGGADTNAGNNVVMRFKNSAAAPVTYSSASQSLGAATAVPVIQSPNPPFGAGSNCSTSYALNQTRTISVPTTNTNPISTIGFTLTLRTNGGNKEAFLDRIRVTPPLIPSGGSYLRVLRWRECVPSPNNCA